MQEIYFHLNNHLWKRKKNCNKQPIQSSFFCAAPKETWWQEAATYICFWLILQKRKDLFLLWMYTNKSKPFTIPIIFMTKRSICFHY